jgi:uncharacterized membrane protein HdeD (DUF308 family)
MLETLKRGWWFLVLSGLCAIAFGVLTFIDPKITVKTLVFLFGAYALANGILTLMVAIRAPKGTPGTGTLWILGLLSVAAGILTFLYPGLTALTLLLVIAWWAITTGIFEIAAAIRLRKQLTNEWLLILSGALSVVFGAFLIIKPGAGALSVVWLIGAYAIAFGVMILAFAVKVKGFAPSMQSARRMA